MAHGKYQRPVPLDGRPSALAMSPINAEAFKVMESASRIFIQAAHHFNEAIDAMSYVDWSVGASEGSSHPARMERHRQDVVSHQIYRHV